MESPSSVLDASALLAYLNDEPGAKAVEDALAQGSAISSVNLAEVLSKLSELGKEPAGVREELQRRGFLDGTVTVFPLTADDAVAVANLHRMTKAQGLSLGDRACLGLALRLGVRAITADRAWSRLRIGINVEVIR